MSPFATKWIAMTTLTAVLFAASAALAQKPDEPKSTALTIQDLKTMIVNMGHEPKEYKNDKGEVYSLGLRIESTYNYTVFFEFSGNKQWLWATVWLKQLPDPKVPAEVLKKLLAANNNGPAHFTYFEKDNMFKVSMVMSNNGIKPAELNRALKMIETAIIQNATAWDPEKWEAKPKSDK